MTASANLDLVRSVMTDWERGDFSSVKWAHPEIEMVFPDGPYPATWTGLEGLAEGSRDWLDAWEEFRFEADEFRELDDGRVLVLVRYSGRGKASRVDVRDIGAKGAQVWSVRDGMVTRFVRYMDRDRALADLGLGPEGDSQR